MLELLAATRTPIRPKLFGKPPPSCFQVRPPSFDRKTPVFSLPEINRQGLRSKRHMVAYRMLGLLTSISRSAQPCSASIYKTFFHVSPPSVVMKTPRSSLGPVLWPSAATYAIL